MYCGTTVTWNGSMIVASMSANIGPRNRNSSRANAYAASVHDTRLPTMLSAATRNEFAMNRPNEMPSADHPST
jgi:hypothetical protein